MSVRGFILQPTYQTVHGRPVVHLSGKLETGQPFLLRDDRRVPSLYLRQRDLVAASQLGVRAAPTEDWRTLEGEAAARVDLSQPSDAPPLRDRLLQEGIPSYEADVRFAMGYLMDLGIRGSLRITDAAAARGADPAAKDGLRVFDNPRLEPCDWNPELSVLSIDIETDGKGQKLLSVALWGAGASEVLLWTPEGLEAPANATSFRNQRDLLAAMVERIRAIDPDVLTGWNVIDFDLRVLDEMSRRLRVPLAIGRGGGKLRLRPTRAPWSNHEATIPGRIVFDGVLALRTSFVKMDRYSLDFVAREVLGEGKTLHGDDRLAEILDTFRNDRRRFVDYNLTDARLVVQILDKLQLVELAVARSRLTGLPIDRVSGSIAAFDFLYLSALHRRRIVAPSVGVNAMATAGEEMNLGGLVMEPEAGLYDNVLVCDFKSLYPSLIRTFQIDPLGYVATPQPGEDLIVAPNQAAFRRQQGILTEMLDALFPRREEAKRAGDKVASHAIKILMNSFYGVLGASSCRFCRPQLASAITAFGRELLRWSRAQIESYGYRVLYGDTDSLFILSGSDDSRQAMELGPRLVADLNRDLAAHIFRRWRVESRLELELEKLYRKLYLPSSRHGRGGARKRYVGQIYRPQADGDDAGKEDGNDDGMEFIGMEVVRRDWTELAKRVQRELYGRLFRGQEVGDYLSMVVHNLRQGRLDDLLVYRKGLGKPLAAYTSTTPPHVVAARKLKKKPGRSIYYLMTREGPEPMAAVHHAIDYEHYVQKQVRPVAEPVLELLSLSFDKVIGDDGQLELF